MSRDQKPDANRPHPPARFRTTFAAALLASLAAVLPRLAMPAGPGPVVAPEARDTGWAFYIDNDLLLGTGRDQQYTGGMALTLSGRRATEYRGSLDPALGAINDWTRFARLGAEATQIRRHSMHFGMAAFTPADIRATGPIHDDRPYASLAFISNTRQRALAAQQIAYQSSLIIGLLGTNIVPEVQDEIHSAAGNPRPRGWSNQISDGGELTAGYVMARHDTVARHDAPGIGDYQVQVALGGSIGLSTQVGAGVSARWGRYNSPWWVFVPDYAQYIGLGTPISGRVSGSGEDDFFVWGGLNLRYSFYNALLEGQFRDSAVTYERGELRSALVEASVGVSVGLGAGTHVTLAFRGRTPEIRNNDASFPVWGSLVLSRAY